MAEKFDDGGPAFPNVGDGSDYDGMSLWDYYAAHAPEMTEQWWADSSDSKETWAKADAAWRFNHANAMIAERKKRMG